MIICFDDNYKYILGYLLGYYIILNDGRHVFYISYIFVSHFMRNKHIGSNLIDLCISHSKKISFITGILLTCNTFDKKLLSFYKNKHFFLDSFLKNNKQFDLFFKSI